MVDASDLTVDLFHTSGYGRTGPVDAALRITHVPTGIAVTRRVTAPSREEADAELLQARPAILREIEERLEAESE
jgi:protein subunit release factor A